MARVGVFICHCGENIARTVDVAAVAATVTAGLKCDCRRHTPASTTPSTASMPMEMALSRKLGDLTLVSDAMFGFASKTFGPRYRSVQKIALSFQTLFWQ